MWVDKNFDMYITYGSQYEWSRYNDPKFIYDGYKWKQLGLEQHWNLISWKYGLNTASRNDDIFTKY